ncbi:MAG: hypothetical protein A2X22_07855 [Bacteroidetes bacterium GWF2_49_14]|nr:MAG: hypothetical protein A2X22_07855 [Bacteroidetes bacterium GWF2_49_14]
MQIQKLPRLLICSLALILLGCHEEEQLPENSFKDIRDGQIYSYVRIGEQIWLAENLSYLPSVSPSNTLPNEYTLYYVYGYEGVKIKEAKKGANYDNYGVLYNWKAASRACPLGWKLPSDNDWKVLERYLGMTWSDADKIGPRSSGSVGRQLKSTSGWVEDGNGENTSGFNVVPAGTYAFNSGFGSLGVSSTFWSSTEIGTSWNFWTRYFRYSDDGIKRDNYNHGSIGLSVRCIKEEY